VKHVLVANWSYELPFGRGSTGLTGLLVRGWQLNIIVTAQSGTPFEVRLGHNQSGNLNTIDFSIHERPNVRPGASNNPISAIPSAGTTQARLCCSPAGTIGNLGRNTLIGLTCELRFLSLQAFALGETKALHCRAEMFNIFNHPNCGVPNQANRTALLPTGMVNPSAGAILRHGDDIATIQFGLKVTF